MSYIGCLRGERGVVVVVGVEAEMALTESLSRFKRRGV
jgi:hypothetical protein